jgi:hypothetical protein
MTMLRIRGLAWVSLFLAGVFPATAFAQASTEPRGGGEIGAGMTYLTVPEGASRDVGTGIAAGLFAVLPLTATYALQPEIQWEHRRSTVLGTERTFDYLAIPILVRMTLFNGIYVDEGPSFHLPLRAKVTSGGTERDVKDNTRRDISIVIGVGRRIGRTGIEGRWDTGFRQVQKTVRSGDVATRHRSLALFVVVG